MHPVSTKELTAYCCCSSTFHKSVLAENTIRGLSRTAGFGLERTQVMCAHAHACVVSVWCVRVSVFVCMHAIVHAYE